MDPAKYDAMLQEMILSLREIFEREMNQTMGEKDAQLLNDVIDVFFASWA